MTTTNPLPHLLTIEELADHLGVTVRHVRRLIAEKRVPYVKWRRFIRFDPDEIARWLDEACHPQRSGSRPRGPGHAKRRASLNLAGRSAGMASKRLTASLTFAGRPEAPRPPVSHRITE
ncbi:MAG: helix-turn-helix domain-containing protein [Acidimicrobiales bacterium]|jgi:excisionase family DNA binding protein